ncbi:hypothetical protein RSOLAG1IB_05053 [Rhizoctonia solani AG-1 IB]|uniref:Zn(2)-C6 fungal-type domain-containing protein n=1 Tax=Thanatephorus cucumeris (strain AG1-IB / isolate 7/3/14) TaxID=1108050 RepID=A0A0B7G2N1_THACB|nr:hypothetical protein RSOLAG1IB_05053 [Rhizoctonia solani AG-1 IB]
MFRIVSKPGPLPTSCRTCRRRQKKCDMTRPCCNRCLRGGYECLGYEDDQPRVRVRRSCPDPLVPASVPTDSITSEVVDCLSASPTTSHTLGPPVQWAALPHWTSDAVSTTDENSSESSSVAFEYLQLQDQIQSMMYSSSSTRQAANTRRSFNTASRARPPGNNLIREFKSAYLSIPPPVNTTRAIKEKYLAHVAGNCE